MNGKYMKNMKKRAIFGGYNLQISHDAGKNAHSNEGATLRKYQKCKIDEEKQGRGYTRAQNTLTLLYTH